MKREISLQTGLDYRRNTASWINGFLFTAGLKLIEIHSHLKLMNLSEKAKNNKLYNRIDSSSYNKAMGLDYYLTKKEDNNKIRIRFLYMGNSGVYLKLPTNYINHPSDYLEILRNLNYHVIVIGRDKQSISIPIPISVFIDFWNWKVEESEGNKNRLQFKGKMRTIDCSHPLKIDVFGKSKIDYLNELL